MPTRLRRDSPTNPDWTPGNPLESFAMGTILCARTSAGVAMGGDGQVTFKPTAVNHEAHRIRRLIDDKVLTGFAASSADSISLQRRVQGNVPKAAIELAKEWRTERLLRRVE